MSGPRVSALGVALLLLLGHDGVDAADCTPERDVPSVLIVTSTAGGFNRQEASVLAEHVYNGIVRGAQSVRWTRIEDVRRDAAVEAQRELVGEGGDPAALARIATPFLLTLSFTRAGNDVRKAVATLASTETGDIIRRVDASLPADPTASVDAAGTLAPRITENILCELLGRRDRPAVPQLTLHVSPQEAPPGGRIRVRAKLTDGSDGRVQPGKDVQIEHRHAGQVLTSLAYPTDLSGEVVREFDVGSQPGRGSIAASFQGRRGRVTRSNPASVPFRVWEPAGDLVIRAPEAALNVGGAATVTATVQDDGTPVPGAAVSFAASDGSVGAPAATTDAEGNATTPFQAPDDNAVVDVTATTPAPPGKRPRAGGDLTATLSFVVDAGVTLSLNAPGTVEGGTSSVTADLVMGGRALPAIDVNFSLEGAGALSAASAPTNAAGRAEILWVAPSGNSSAEITAEAVVDGQTYTRTVTVGAGAVVGGMTAKALPGYWREENLTEVAVGVDPSPFCFSSLTVANACRESTSADFGGPPADLPVSLRADAGSYWASLALTQPRSGVVVAEFSGSLTGTNDSISGSALLELTFDGPGTLDIVVDDPVAAPSGRWSVLRPGGGASTFQGANMTTLVVRNPERTGSTPVTEAGKFEVRLAFGAYTRDDPAFSGTRRMTLTFRPQ